MALFRAPGTRVVLDVDQYAAYQRVTAAIVTGWCANDTIARYELLGNTSAGPPTPAGGVGPRRARTPVAKRSAPVSDNRPGEHCQPLPPRSSRDRPHTTATTDVKLLRALARQPACDASAPATPPSSAGSPRAPSTPPSPGTSPVTNAAGAVVGALTRRGVTTTTDTALLCHRTAPGPHLRHRHHRRHPRRRPAGSARPRCRRRPGGPPDAPSHPRAATSRSASAAGGSAASSPTSGSAAGPVATSASTPSPPALTATTPTPLCPSPGVPRPRRPRPHRCRRRRQRRARRPLHHRRVTV
jgi:hypothetical protein